MGKYSNLIRHIALDRGISQDDKAKAIESLLNRQNVLDGGPGSGNFGHKGRPGKRGGSGEGEGESEGSSGGSEGSKTAPSANASISFHENTAGYTPKKHTPGKVLSKMAKIAWQYKQYSPDYVGERRELINKWNDLVPAAKAEGVAGKDLNELFNNYDKGLEKDLTEKYSKLSKSPEWNEAVEIRKEMQGLSRFGEGGKKRAALAARLEELEGKMNKPSQAQKPKDKPKPQKVVTKDPEHPVTKYKEDQFAIIQETNPMRDNYHTGIRKPSDIQSAKEAFGNGDDFVYPDFTKEDAEEALKSGKITVYSSHPIQNGNFVTPSRMMAGDYAGEGKVYSKTIPVNDVAWINSSEGQLAKVPRRIQPRNS